jgi:hypothetical protein
LDQHFILTSDIDLNVEPWNKDTGWEPVGTIDHPFTGGFNGNAHIISSLFIQGDDAENIGLFGVIDSPGQIHDLGLSDISVHGSGNTGGLVGFNSGGTVSRVHVDGSVTASEEGGKAGGLVGHNTGTITESYAMAYTYSHAEAGGLAGASIEGLIKDSHAGGRVAGVDGAGGLVGLLEGGQVLRSYSDGLVLLLQGEGDQGGLVGKTIGNPEISSSYWNKEKSRQTYSAGGQELTTAQMRERSSFVNWNLGTDCTWNHEHEFNGGFPYLTFSPLHHLTTLVSPNNSGTVAWAGYYPHGLSAVLAIIPEEGYSIEQVSGGQGTLDGDTYTIEHVTEDLTVTAVFDYVKGDVNFDGKVNMKDAILLIQYAAGQTDLTDAQKKRGNISGHVDDNSVGMADALKILGITVGGLSNGKQNK